MINSRSVLELTPAARLKALQWQIECHADGLIVIFISTYRDVEFQDYLYAQGRKNKQPILTNAKGGESEHQKRTAWDFCVMNGKKCDWKNVEAFTKAGVIAENQGLVWSGRWQGRFKENGHIQLNN